MRNLSKRPVKRLRPVLMLETLEDRRVMSAGGLFSALQPFAVADTSHSTLSSTLTSLVAVPTTALTQVGGVVRDLGGVVPTSPLKASLADVSLNLNVDVPFLRTESLRLDVGLNPIGSDQPILTLAVGGKTSAGSADGPLMSVVPQVQVDAGGSNGVGVSVGTPVNAPNLPVVDVNAGSSTGVTASVKASPALDAVEASASGATITLPNSTASQAGAVTGFVPATGNDAAAATSPAATATPIFVAPSTAALIAPNANVVDGGGSNSAVDAAFIALPTTGVAVADAAAAGAAGRPIDLGGGAETAALAVEPEMDASGLMTHFQPYSLNGGDVNLMSLLGPTGPQSGWLAAWLARLSQMAPWLVGLIAAGTALEIRRRRRAKAAKSANAAF